MTNKITQSAKKGNQKTFSIRSVQDSTEKVIDLKNPKFLSPKEAINNKDTTKKVENDIDIKNITKNVIEDNNSKTGSKYKQKNKNDTDDLLENKKNKLKNKRKSRKEIDLDEDENNLYENESIVTKGGNLGLSTMRPAKPIKSIQGTSHKKKTIPTKKINNREDKVKNQNNVEKIEFVRLKEAIKISDLADRLNISEMEIIKILFMKGIIATINQIIDLETVEIITTNLGIKLETSWDENEEKSEKNLETIVPVDLEDSLTKRPPVVTIMGHVDHGKTTLLDAIRKTNIAEKELGGITQMIAADEVIVETKEKIEKVVFIDTPGHEAFTGMRARGANLTDIIILIVAADDGIKPQTIEAIEHIKRVKSPCIVAINKIDKPDANVSKITENLIEYGILSDKLGGDIPIVEISALNGTNINQLLENILILAELSDLKANPNTKASGTIIEAHLDRTKGPVATLLVQNGTLKIGDLIVAGNITGKTKSLLNSNSETIKTATPSSIAYMYGLSQIATSGNKFQVVNNEKEAKVLVNNYNEDLKPNQHALSQSRISIKNVSSEQQEIKQINLIVKADTPGSLEAIMNCLSQIPQNKIQIKVVSLAAGDITETDIDLAKVTNSIITGFNSNITNNTKIAKNLGQVNVKTFNIIYDLIEYIEEEMKNLLDIEYMEEELGIASVKTTFPLSKGVVAGCYVSSGKLEKECLIKVIRDNETIFEGKLDSLKRVKEDVKEIEKDNECGVVTHKFNNWNKNDTIVAYKLVAKAPSLI
uniref:translation initiation factor 2 n=1 Tax=Erythrolobus coxiae TaxID=362235 RepID=UPI001FCE2EC6|nr:translation initiation factor 2 [Erythrolobus coxiae]UNJ17764.1 translation initiation factor 2 [Erythrolobus coxiae]